MRKCRKQDNPIVLTNKLEALSSLSREELLVQWGILYNIKPPFKISRELLVEAIAYRMQEQELGGLKPSICRFLAKVAEDASVGRQIIASPIIKPGTRLLREWHGVTHEVVVLENGIQFEGKQYRSLSEVARAITGARWSGPLFFGLKKQEAA